MFGRAAAPHVRLTTPPKFLRSADSRMADILARAVEWAAADGPPNAVFLIAVLTAPWLWADYAKQGAKRLLRRFVPGSEPPTDTPTDSDAPKDA